MRCDYQKDFEWKWDSTKTETQQPNLRYLRWHRNFMPEVSSMGRRLAGVYEVNVKVVLFPNILHIDVLWALGRVLDRECAIFATVPVQGIVTCTWDNFISHVYDMALFFTSLDLIAFIRLGLDEGGDSAPRCWTLVVAGVLSTAVELTCRSGRYFHKACQEPEVNLWSISYLLFQTTFFFDWSYLICQIWVVKALRPLDLEDDDLASALMRPLHGAPLPSTRPDATRPPETFAANDGGANGICQTLRHV
eukprot:1769326-Amphidinium_carterae.1